MLNSRSTPRVCNPSVFMISALTFLAYLLAWPGHVSASATFSNTAQITGFDGAFQNANWTETTQTFGCGSSRVDASASSVVLSTAENCAAITALYTHSNFDAGAPADGRVEFAYAITQSEPHSYEAIVGVNGGQSNSLTSSVPRQGRMAMSVRAGEQVVFQIRKSGSFGQSKLIIADFSFTPRSEGLAVDFAPTNWTPTTQSFGCGASTVAASASTVTLSTANGCGQILAGFRHTNFGNGAPVDGSVEFHYELDVSEPHSFEAFVSLSDTEQVALSAGDQRSGSVAFSVTAGQQLGFAIRKLSGFGVSRLKISGFSFTPSQPGLVADYAPAKWNPTTQSFGCGSSMITESAEVVVLETATDCAQIAALYTHDNGGQGAPANGTARFSYAIAQTGSPSYAAAFGILDAASTSLGNTPSSGFVEVPLRAGERIQFEIRKLSGFGTATLSISDFSFVEQTPGFTEAFDSGAWTPVTQSFGCGASDIAVNSSEVLLSSAAGCAQIAAIYTYSNGGAGIQQSGTIELDYEIGVSSPHSYQIEIGVPGGPTRTRTDTLPSSGRMAFSVEPGDLINFVLRKQGSAALTTLSIRNFRFTPRTINLSNEFAAGSWTATTQSFGCGSSSVVESASLITLATSSGCSAILARYSFDRGGAGASQDGLLQLSYDINDVSGQYQVDVVVPGRQTSLLATDEGRAGALSMPLFAGEQLIIEIRKLTGGSMPTLTISGFSFTPSIESAATTTVNFSYTYWNPSEPGWGFNAQHQGSLVFGTWYSYAPEDGKPMFLTVEANEVLPGIFSGPVFRIAGTPFQLINNAQAFTAVTQVGTAILVFDSNGALSLDYSLFGVEQNKQLEPFVFAATAPTCTGTTGSRADASNFSDLWWNSAEPGWGLTLAHQGDAIFLLWYTYGEAGRDQWLSGLLSRQADGSFAGTLERPSSGTPLPQINGPATSFPVPTVGSAQLRFDDGETGTFSYSLEGFNQSKPIERFVVLGPDEPQPVCVE